MKNVERLPDCYRKDSGGNNDKLLLVNELAAAELRQDIDSVRNALDLKQATGKTLDLYGNMLEQLRGALTDKQYQHMLFARIGMNNAKGDYRSIINALVSIFGTASEQITGADFELLEDEKPCTVKLTRFPPNIEELGFTTRQMIQMIKDLLPVCVAFLTQYYSQYTVPVRYDNTIRFLSDFYPRYNAPFLCLDGDWCLDGSYAMDGYQNGTVLDFYPLEVRYGSVVKTGADCVSAAAVLSRYAAEPQYHHSIGVLSDFYPRAPTLRLDGDWCLDGEYLLDSTTTGGASDFYPAALQLSGSVRGEIGLDSGNGLTTETAVDVKAAAGVRCLACSDAGIGTESAQQIEITIEAGEETGLFLTVEKDLWCMDGLTCLDGSVCLDAEILQYEL